MISISNSFLSIGQAAAQLGVSVVTIRRWCKLGKISEAFRTIGNHRRFTSACILKLQGVVTVRADMGYARVSSHDQKKDLVTQTNFLSRYSDEVITDLGSGLNCKKTGLRKLITLLLNKKIGTLHLTHKDRLLRFGHELVFQICRWAKTDVVIHNEATPKTFEEELCKDVITLMTVFNARLYGKRSHENRQKRKLIQANA